MVPYLFGDFFLQFFKILNCVLFFHNITGCIICPNYSAQFLREESYFAFQMNKYEPERERDNHHAFTFFD